jgi:ABC-type sugar transport system ATPase subunit
LAERVLELENIGKTFAGVTVLRNVNLHLEKGEVHALLGENGAGKSTLIKILSGYYLPDRGGTIRMNGKPVVFYSPKDAMDASIHTIYQELTLCPQMSIAENIVLDKQHSFRGFLQKKRDFHEMAVKALERLGQGDLNPNALVKDLSIAQQQVVEIAKAITSNAQIVLMDEPTSSISQSDADKLMNIIRGLRDDGVTIVYISHRLHEIDGIANRITVLRDGDLVGTVNNADVTERDLIRMMVGRELTNMYPKMDVPITEPVLRVENLSSEGAFKGVSFDVRKGEIFGIGGLVGAKRTELLETLFGLRPITEGRIFVNGKEFVPKSPLHAIRNKIAFVTEDRKKSGLVLCLPVFENINLINAQKKLPFGWVDWRWFMRIAEKQRKALNIRLSRIEQTVSTLSGGNQQKVALAKWLEFEPDLILFDEPTRGIDIGAKTEIYSIMGALAARGTAIIMVSSELPELLSVADRIMVLREGEAKGIVRREDATQELIMSLAALKHTDAAARQQERTGE